MFTLEFYETPNKLAPLEEFLEDLKKKDKSLFAKVLRDMELLESKGNLLREPYTKPIEDGIFELRTKQHNNIVRVFFFFIVGKKIILTHGFIKTTDKTPKSEIEKAKEYKKEYEGRKKWNFPIIEKKL